MYLTSHFGFAAMASGNDLESDVIAFNINTGMLRQKGARTIAKPITTSINSPKKTQTRCRGEGSQGPHDVLDKGELFVGGVRRN